MLSELERPKLNITLPKLSLAELRVLAGICTQRLLDHQAYCTWVLQLIADEVTRRSNPGTECQMAPTPVWTESQLAELLVSCYVFDRFPMPESVHRFLDDLSLNITADASALLSMIGEQSQ